MPSDSQIWREVPGLGPAPANYSPNHSLSGLGSQAPSGQHVIASSFFTLTIGTGAWQSFHVIGSVVLAHFIDGETSSGIKCLASHWQG